MPPTSAMPPVSPRGTIPPPTAVTPMAEAPAATRSRPPATCLRSPAAPRPRRRSFLQRPARPGPPIVTRSGGRLVAAVRDQAYYVRYEPLPDLRLDRFARALGGNSFGFEVLSFERLSSEQVPLGFHVERAGEIVAAAIALQLERMGFPRWVRAGPGARAASSAAWGTLPDRSEPDAVAGEVLGLGAFCREPCATARRIRNEGRAGCGGGSHGLDREAGFIGVSSRRRQRRGPRLSRDTRNGGESPPEWRCDHSFASFSGIPSSRNLWWRTPQSSDG